MTAQPIDSPADGAGAEDATVTPAELLDAGIASGRVMIVGVSW